MLFILKGLGDFNPSILAIGVTGERFCSTGLMIVLASTFVASTRRRIGKLICSICLARCTVSFFQVGKDLPQNLHGSSSGRFKVSWWHFSNMIHAGSVRRAFLM